jgi:hypothetical protein
MKYNIAYFLRKMVTNPLPSPYIKGEGGEEMAQALLENTKLRLVFEAGTDEKGNVIYKTKTYANVNEAATADQLFQAANAISALSTRPLVGINREDRYNIV